MQAKVKSPTAGNSAGQRLYDVDAFLGRLLNQRPSVTAGSSSAKQRGDLQRQCAQMRSLYPNAEIIRDIGEDSTGSARDSSPYWSEFTGG